MSGKKLQIHYLTNELVEANNLNMLDEIREERHVELALEDLWFDDLRRWKTAEDILPNNLKGCKYVGTFKEASKEDGGWSTPEYENYDENGFIIVDTNKDRMWAEKNYLSPIPLDQLGMNPKLGQNKGW